MKMRDKIKLIGTTTREGVYETHFMVANAAVKAATASSRKKQVGSLAFAATLYAMYAGTAVAGGNGACGGSATTSLTGFISSAATFMMAIGGVAALLMFAIGGFLIIVGGSESRVRRGMSMLKNAVIGLVVLASGVFIKTVVLNFVGGATSNNGAASGCVGQNGGLK